MMAIYVTEHPHLLSSDVTRLERHVTMNEHLLQDVDSSGRCDPLASVETRVDPDSRQGCVGGHLHLPSTHKVMQSQSLNRHVAFLPH